MILQKITTGNIEMIMVAAVGDELCSIRRFTSSVRVQGSRYQDVPQGIQIYLKVPRCTSSYLDKAQDT